MACRAFLCPMGDGKRDAKSLVSSILGGAPAADAGEAHDADDAPASPAAEANAAADESTPADPDEPGGDDAEAAELIAVYFELEEPEERDALFDQIIRLRSQVVVDFLRVMMEEDEDEYVRAAAAAEMTRRGDPNAAVVLANDLEDPEEPFFFELAVQVLSEVLGAKFFDRLLMLWQDPELDADQKREVMLGMETADTERALATFIDLVAGIEEVTVMPDDLVEIAILAFLRHGHRDAVPALTGLRDRIDGAELDEEERRELVGMVQEGIDLLTGELGEPEAEEA